MNTAYITLLLFVMVFNPAHGSGRYSRHEDTGKLLRLQGVRIQALERMVHELKGTVHEFKGTVHELKATISELQGTVHKMQSTIHELNGTVHELKGNVHELKGNVHELKGTIHELKGTVHEQQLEINKLNQIPKSYRNGKEVEYIPADSNGTDCTTKSKREVDGFDVLRKQQIKRMITDKARRLLVGNVPVQSSTVAFYAYLGKNELNLGLHHSLIFDVVITNLGNGYDNRTGAFIAPQDGVYVLTITIFPNRETITSVHILRNSEVVGEIFGDVTNGSHVSGSTGIVVVTMSTGDAATIRTSSTHPSRGELLSDPNMKTSFAGWKLADIS